MTINGKIDAMKAIRALKVQLIESTLDSGHVVQRVMVGSLRDVKDIVEGIMEFSQTQLHESVIENGMKASQNELHEAHAEIMDLRMQLENMREDMNEFDRIKELLNEEKARNTRLMNRLQAVHVALED